MTIQKTDWKGKTVNVSASLESSRRLLKGGEMPRDQTKAVALKIEEGNRFEMCTPGRVSPRCLSWHLVFL